MCLLIQKPIQLVASRDIPVVKMLFTSIREDNSVEYITPFRSVPVNINELQVPSPIKPSLRLHMKFVYGDNTYYEIGKGYVHSYRIAPSKSTTVKSILYGTKDYYRAFIPKGTIYFATATEVASEQLYISDKHYTENEDLLFNESSEAIAMDSIVALQAYTPTDITKTIHIGDCQLKDGTYANPIEVYKQGNIDQVVGVVQGFKQGKKTCDLYTPSMPFIYGNEFLRSVCGILMRQYDPKDLYKRKSKKEYGQI